MNSKIDEKSMAFFKEKSPRDHLEGNDRQSEPKTRNTQILLIEDDEIPRRLIQGFLKNERYQITHAENGQEALKIIYDKSFDLILTDMEMPIMDGYEIIRHIRQNPKWKELPIIAITANTMQSDIEKCFSAGCTDYLAKPINKKALLQKIGCYLSKPEDGNNADIEDEKTCEFAEDLKELFPFYLDSLKEDLSKLKTAYQQLDFESMRFIGHNNKGSGKLYGLNDLSRVAEKLEKAALSKNKDVIKGLIPEMERLYELIRT